MAFLVVLYILNCMSGKNTNESYSKIWLKKSLAYLDDNYSHLGLNSEYSSNSTELLVKESYNQYKTYATGRVNIKWANIGLDVSILKKFNTV